MAKRRVNWAEVFEHCGGAQDWKFTDEQKDAAGPWLSCAVGENDPKLAKRFSADGTGPPPRSKKARAMYQLGIAFPSLVQTDNWGAAARIFNAIRVLSGKKEV